MKLEEKLMKLRKQNAWSQEEFAEKLDVSRQTISKWELGQTVPDTENLSKIATIFGISVNDLLDDNANPVSTTGGSQNNTFKIVILVIVLVLVFAGIGAIVLNKVFNMKVNPENPKTVIQMFKEFSIPDIFKSVFGQIEEGIKRQEESVKQFEEQKKQIENSINESMAEQKKNSFNSTFENLYYGSTNGFFMNNFIDTVIKSNEKHPDNLITVSYNGTETNNSNELKSMKKKFNTNTTYEISYEYDENGLIKKAKVER